MKIFKKIKDYINEKIVLIKNYNRAVCNIEEPHAHKYINDKGFTRYISGEKKRTWGYERCEDYIYLPEKDQELLEFLNRKGLLRIVDNETKIKRDQSRLMGYYEYQYEYEEMHQTPIYSGSGKDQTVTYITTWTTEYDWTRDITHDDLTGYRRWCYYLYTSYKVSKNEKGKYVLEKNSESKDIISTKDEYPYIKEDYYGEYAKEKEKYKIDFPYYKNLRALFENEDDYYDIFYLINTRYYEDYYKTIVDYAIDVAPYCQGPKIFKQDIITFIRSIDDPNKIDKLYKESIKNAKQRAGLSTGNKAKK